MGNLGFQELIVMFVGIGIPIILIFLLIKYLKGRKRLFSTSITEELEKLHLLKEKGIITQEEFDNKKAQLLK